MVNVETKKEGFVVGRLLMLVGIVLAFLSVFQLDTIWIHGSYEIGGSTIVWDDAMNVLWPTYFLSQWVGILLVCGGIIIYLIELKASVFSIGRSLSIVLLGSIVIYYFLISSAYAIPRELSIAVSIFLLMSSAMAHYGDRVQEWFEAL